MHELIQEIDCDIGPKKSMEIVESIDDYGILEIFLKFMSTKFMEGFALYVPIFLLIIALSMKCVRKQWHVVQVNVNLSLGNSEKSSPCFQGYTSYTVEGKTWSNGKIAAMVQILEITSLCLWG
ncbi:hypothetical protein K1719_026184 [Acacia pycnantha]|nr:hypothetical protein K1719_026184 [Acacia pycnantha]